MDRMSEQETVLQSAWDAAVANCLEGHEHCSYGGMSIHHGYWLADENCQRSHGDHCAWCGIEAVTGFAGRVSSGDIYAVPACQPCADAWVAEHPEWQRRDPAADTRTTGDLLADIEADYQAKLADMDPVTRAVWEEADRVMENMMLYGTSEPPADGKPTFAGIESIFGVDQAVKLVAPYPTAAPPGPPRQRYNPATGKWEAAR
jgi:hypothetical protein